MDLSRRTLLGGTVGLAAAGIWWKIAHQGPTDPIPLLNAVADITIPPTDTPGAVAVGVPAFVKEAVAVSLAGAEPDLIERLAGELDAAGEDHFADLPPARQAAVLTRHDKRCFSPSAPKDTAWPTVKKLILMGYYSSEVGASKELRYELDRGGFTADMPLQHGDRAFFNNWFGMML